MGGILMLKWPRYADVALLIVGAMLTGMTLVFPTLGFLQWGSMIPLFLAAYRICSDSRVRLIHAYWYGFLTVFVYYIVTYHWFVNMYPLDFVGLGNGASIAVVLLGWIGLSLLQAIVGGLIFLLFRLLDKLGIFGRLPLLKPFVFAALWVVFEWSSTLTWTGVPWGRLCLGQIKYLPMLQSASLFGSYFVSFLILTVNGLLAYALLYRTRQILCVSVAGALLAGNLTYGVIARAIPHETADPLTVAVLQCNISSHEKWSSASTRRTMAACAELTRSAAAEGAELVVLSETVFPYDLNLRSDLRDFLSDLARECNVAMVVGGFYETWDGQYNALYYIDQAGEFYEDYYAKRHLVPFGEYVPMRSFIETIVPPLAELSELSGSLEAGEDSALFSTAFGNIGSMICFDSIYEGLAMDAVRDGAMLMVVSTNDSWFKDSAAVYQHQAQSQLRAIETGRYVARSANTGISTIIAPDGEILAWIDPLERGYAVAEVASLETRTLYSIIGNLFIYLNIAFLAGAFGVASFLWKKEKSVNALQREKKEIETTPPKDL